MQTSAAPNRSSLAGSTVLMACACGAASSTAKIFALAGLGLTASVIHPAIIAVGAALILAGFWRRAPRWVPLAVAAFGVMAVAALLLPQHDMSSGPMGKSMLPWNGTELTGAALFVVSIAMLAYAFWRAYPSQRPAASGTAIGGMALATGCTCCMVTGATAGMVITLGAAAPFQTQPMLFWIAMFAVAIGVYRLGGLQPTILVGIGALLIRTGLDWINTVLGQPSINGINPYFVAKYALMLGGYATLMYAFSLAYKVSEGRATALARQDIQPTPEPVA